MFPGSNANTHWSGRRGSPITALPSPAPTSIPSQPLLWEVWLESCCVQLFSVQPGTEKVEGTLGPDLQTLTRRTTGNSFFQLKVKGHSVLAGHKRIDCSGLSTCFIPIHGMNHTWSRRSSFWSAQQIGMLPRGKSTSWLEKDWWRGMFPGINHLGRCLLTKINKHMSPQVSRYKRHGGAESRIPQPNCMLPLSKIFQITKHCASLDRERCPCCTWNNLCPR